MIELKRISDQSEAAAYLVRKIAGALNEGREVLWLVAGGSAMDVAVKAAQALSANQGLDRLTVTLTDERYGKTGHADSNWRQLNEKGFSLPGAKLEPILSGESMTETAARFDRLLNESIASGAYAIALAGMGPDGHIFGIKPGSPAVDAAEDIAAYDWDDFKRLTPTLNMLKKLDEVVIYAVGQEKHRQLDLLEKDLPANDQPAQQLKKLKKVIIFNDYKGGSA